MARSSAQKRDVYRRRMDPQMRWIIDPIDGTRNFTRGIPYWGTLCGLECDGEIVAGIMALPALKTIYYASKGARSL